MRYEQDGYWIDRDLNGNINLGLTKQKLCELGELIMCIPQAQTNRNVKVVDRLFSIVTHKCLKTLRFPVSGKLIYLQKELEDNVTTLTENTIVATLKDSNEM